MLDAHVANAPGGFAANANSNARKNGIGKHAVCDADIVSHPTQRITLFAAAGFERYTVIARGYVTVIDPYSPARIDVDAVAVAAGAADGQPRMPCSGTASTVFAFNAVSRTWPFRLSAC
jgi:hypothetical protein